MQFVRKYIHMAKSVKPKLTEEASAYISECYAELRSFDTSKTDRERVYLKFSILSIQISSCLANRLLLEKAT